MINPRYTAEQAEEIKDENGFITAHVTVSLGDLTENGTEEFLDDIERKVLQDDYLEDVSYKPIGVTDDGLIIISVTGKVDTF